MSPREPFVVAIDGPAAAGKGTIGRLLAERFGFNHLDTGLLYRAVARKALDQGGVTEDRAIRIARTLAQPDLAADGLRSAETAEAASQVAVIGEVRRALVEFQRSFAAQPSGAVLDGRDIGTVICPDADVKLFVTASPEERARRRHAELGAGGDATPYRQVLAQVIERDRRDAARAEAPLRQAADAHLLDTTELSIDAAVAEAARIIEQALSRKRN